MEFIASQLINGLVYGVLLFLMSAGLSLIFGLGVGLATIGGVVAGPVLGLYPGLDIDIMRGVPEMELLRTESLFKSFGSLVVTRDLNLVVKAGERHALIGPNGAGKTTAVLTIMGYLKPRSGEIRYNGQSIAGWPPYKVARHGFGWVPQERGIFPSLTVRENLTTMARAGEDSRWDLARIYKLFPRLEERSANLGFQLSGGEQQMLSIARALMLNPSLMLLDEPCEGLAPVIVQEIVEVMKVLKREGLAVLLVEQNLRVALDIGDRHYVLSKGETCFTGTSAELENNESVLKTYLSV